MDSKDLNPTIESEIESPNYSTDFIDLLIKNVTSENALSRIEVETLRVIRSRVSPTKWKEMLRMARIEKRKRSEHVVDPTIANAPQISSTSIEGFTSIDKKVEDSKLRISASLAAARYLSMNMKAHRNQSSEKITLEGPDSEDAIVALADITRELHKVLIGLDDISASSRIVSSSQDERNVSEPTPLPAPEQNSIFFNSSRDHSEQDRRRLSDEGNRFIGFPAVLSHQVPVPSIPHHAAVATKRDMNECVVKWGVLHCTGTFETLWKESSVRLDLTSRTVEVVRRIKGDGCKESQTTRQQFVFDTLYAGVESSGYIGYTGSYSGGSSSSLSRLPSGPAAAKAAVAAMHADLRSHARAAILKGRGLNVVCLACPYGNSTVPSPPSTDRASGWGGVTASRDHVFSSAHLAAVALIGEDGGEGVLTAVMGEVFRAVYPYSQDSNSSSGGRDICASYNVSSREDRDMRVKRELFETTTTMTAQAIFSPLAVEDSSDSSRGVRGSTSRIVDAFAIRGREERDEESERDDSSVPRESIKKIRVKSIEDVERLLGILVGRGILFGKTNTVMENQATAKKNVGDNSHREIERTPSCVLITFSVRSRNHRFPNDSSDCGSAGPFSASFRSRVNSVFSFVCPCGSGSDIPGYDLRTLSEAAACLPHPPPPAFSKRSPLTRVLMAESCLLNKFIYIVNFHRLDNQVLTTEHDETLQLALLEVLRVTTLAKC